MPKRITQRPLIVLLALKSLLASPMAIAYTPTTSLPTPLIIGYKKTDTTPAHHSLESLKPPPIAVEYRGLLSLTSSQQTFPMTISADQESFILCNSRYYRPITLNELGLKVEAESECKREFQISNTAELSGLRITPSGSLAKALAAATLLVLQKIDPVQYRARTTPIIGEKLSGEIAKAIYDKNVKAFIDLSFTVKAAGNNRKVKFRSEILNKGPTNEQINFEYTPKNFSENAKKFACPQQTTDQIISGFCRIQPFLELKPRIDQFLEGNWAKEDSIDSKLANIIDQDGLTIGMKLAKHICAPQQRSEESGFSAGEDEISLKKAKALEMLFRAGKEDYQDSLGRTLKFYAVYYGCNIDLKRFGKATKDSAGVPLFMYALAGKNKNHIETTWTEEAKDYLKDPVHGEAAAVGSKEEIPSLSRTSILELIFSSAEATEKFSSLTGRNLKNQRYFNEASNMANSLSPEAISFLKKIRISLWSTAGGNNMHVLAHALSDGYRRKKDKVRFDKLESDFASGPDGILTVCNATHDPDNCLADNSFCAPIHDRSKKVLCMQKTGRGEELPIEGGEWKIADMRPGRTESFCAPIKSQDFEYSACLLRHVYGLPAKEAETHLKKLLSHQEGAVLFLSELAPYSRVSSLIDSKNLANICLNSPFSFKVVKSKSGSSGFVGDLCINMLRQKPTQDMATKAADCNKSGESKVCLAPLLLSPISESIAGLKRLCDQNNPLACTRVAFSQQLSSREEMSNAAKRLCEASDYTVFCEMGYLSENEKLPNEKLIQIAKNSPSFGKALLQRIERNQISLKDVEPYAADFEGSCTEHSGSCQLATLIYKSKSDSAGIDRITNAAFERCRDSLQCLDFSNLIASSPKFETQARTLCSSGNVGLCKALRSGSTLKKDPFSYSNGKQFCTTVQPIYRDECLFTLFSFIGADEENAKDFCLSNDKFQDCDKVFLQIAKHKLSKEEQSTYRDYCYNGSKNGACMVLAYHLLAKDRKLASEYLQQSCKSSGYFPTVCERALNALVERKMAKEVQSFSSAICGLNPRHGICSSKNLNSLRASDSPADLKIVETECNAKKRNSCLGLAMYYKEKGKPEKSKPILREYCELSSDKSGCPGFPRLFGPNVFRSY